VRLSASGDTSTAGFVTIFSVFQGLRRARSEISITLDEGHVKQETQSGDSAEEDKKQ
jgi:hypothetical protein